MDKVMDKLKIMVKSNRNILIFLFVLLIISLISGSIFLLITSSGDKKIVSDYLIDFFENLNSFNCFDSFKNCLISNVLLVILIWILGFTIIGFPVVILLYFMKAFGIGFAITSFIVNYKIKGIIYAIIYVMGYVSIFLFVLILLVMCATKFSIKILENVRKKQSFNYKKIVQKYLYILIVSVIIILFSSLIESFIMPFLFKIVVLILK